jgi:transposase InsO family protein
MHRVFFFLYSSFFYLFLLFLACLRYLFLTDGSKRYNCSIIDLYDRSVVASLNGKRIDSQLAIDTLNKAIVSQSKAPIGVTLHSDQGVQYTSKEFNAFCLENNIIQSMSKAGCPYDNAPMERYFNSQKNELIYHYHFHNDDELDNAINNYAYLFYNHKRPHTYNNGLTPFEARYKKVH